MTGVILGLNPHVRLVDVSHHITHQDIMEGAFVLRSVVPSFPKGTVHLAVVDPGVGTDRKPIALRYRDHYFVGPDNGLFSLLFSGQEPDLIVELDKPQFWGTPSPSLTFQGRDLFAPVAARLSAGLSLSSAGSPISEIKSLRWALPITDEAGIQGWVVHVDQFGNCITNITAELFQQSRNSRSFKCYSGNAIIEECNAMVDAGDATLVFNSSNYLEIAIHTGSASNLLDIRKGTSVRIVFLEERG